MLKYVIVYFCLIHSVFALSQATVSGSQGIGTIIDMSDPVGIINGKDMPPSLLVNSPYLFDTFQSSTFGFRGNALTYPVNVDLITKSLDIIYRGDTVFVELTKVEYIESILDNDSVKIITTLKAENSEEFEGVFIELVEGRYSLYLNKYHDLDEPDFDPRFNVGSKDYSVTHLERYIVLKDGYLFELANKAKRNGDIFGDDMAEVELILKKKSINFKALDDLVVFFSLLNQL